MLNNKATGQQETQHSCYHQKEEWHTQHSRVLKPSIRQERYKRQIKPPANAGQKKTLTLPREWLHTANEHNGSILNERNGDKVTAKKESARQTCKPDKCLAGQSMAKQEA